MLKAYHLPPKLQSCFIDHGFLILAFGSLIKAVYNSPIYHFDEIKTEKGVEWLISQSLKNDKKIKESFYTPPLSFRKKSYIK
jgi:hypothetical protein